LIYILPPTVCVYLHSNFSGGRHNARKTSISDVQGHPRSMNLVPIESAYAISYESVIVTLVLSYTVSEIWQVLCAPDSAPIPP